MENEKILTAREMAVELQKKNGDIKRLEAEKVELERRLNDAKSYLMSPEVRVKELREEYRRLRDETASTKVLEARLRIIQEELELVKKTIDLHPWSPEAIDMVEKAARGFAGTAKAMAESARENVDDFLGKMDEVERASRENRFKLETDRKSDPGKGD